MRIGSVRLVVEWGHLALVAGIAGFCVWYWLDARAASSNVQNLLLIQPAALLALGLCVVVAAGSIRVHRNRTGGDEAAPEPEHAPKHATRDWRGIQIAALLGLFVASLLCAGFDVATFVFMAAGMYVLGERRPLLLAGYSAGFAAAMSYAFKFMLSVPVPTLIL